jgi:hypothetical protein
MTNYYNVAQVLFEMGVREFVIEQDPKNEQEWNQYVRKVVGQTPDEIGILGDAPPSEVTWDEVQAKMDELNAAYPMKMLREKRDQLLAETDWMALKDRAITEAETTYRQKLRDLPNDFPDVDLDNNGNFINVTFPTKP